MFYGDYRSGTVSVLTMVGRYPFDMNEIRSRYVAQCVHQIENGESITRGAVGGDRLLRRGQVLTREGGAAEGRHAAGCRSEQRK